jgi:DMSO/TMAO reductase YedYZ heme-binding membrane subunit
MFGKLKTVFVITFLVTIIPISYAQALDSDFDGITNDAEINIYKTNPDKADTDGDGVLDYKEILEKTDPNNKYSSSIQNAKENSAEIISTRDPITWYVARITGIAAFIMFTFVISFGLLMSSKALIKFRKIGPATALEFHQFVGLLSILMVVVHFSSFFIDDVLRLTPFQALVPFQIQTGLKSTLGYDLNLVVAFGISAFYLGIVLVITSFYRGKIVSTKIWRTIHYMSFLFYVLFLAHGFFTGSDSNEWWMRAIYLTSIVAVLSLLMLRIFSRKLFFPKRPAPASNTLPAIEPLKPTTIGN